MIELGETFSSATITVRDSGGVAGTATVTAVVTLPDGTTTSPSVANPTTGSYTFDYTTTQAGRHTYVVTATGGVLGSLIRKITDSFVVTSATAAGIVSLAEVKAHLNIPATSTGSDTELELMVAAATEKIEARVGPVVQRTVTERHTGWTDAIYLREAPVVSVTSVVAVAAGVVPVTVGLLDIDPVTGRVVYTSGYGWFPAGAYLWTYTAGRTTIPAGLRLAALNYVKGSWETQRGPAGLPLQGGADDPVEQPGMGLVIWRLEQDLQPFLRLPGIA